MHGEEEVVPPVELIVRETIVRDRRTAVKYAVFPEWEGIEWAADTRRSHWWIENRVHHSLDWSCQEDGIIAGSGFIGVNLGILNRGSLNITERFRPDLPNSGIMACTAVNPLKNLTVTAHRHEEKQPITNNL